MSKLPNVSGKQCIEVLKKIGFYQKRRQSSHIILRRDNPFLPVVVPDHQTLAKGNYITNKKINNLFYKYLLLFYNHQDLFYLHIFLIQCALLHACRLMNESIHFQMEEKSNTRLR